MYEDACVQAALTVISSASNTYTEKSKRLGMSILPFWRLKRVIFTYSNILLSVSLMNIANMNTARLRVSVRQVRPLGLFEVLTRNRQAPWDEEVLRDAHKNNQTECVQYLLDNDCPLPPGWRYEDGELYDS